MSKSYKEDHRPALQFYINDWLAEPGLNMCSLAAQGLWIKMICYMFKSDFRGCLKANGKQITPKQLSKLCSENEEIIIELLGELKEYEVYSTLEDGTIYSRRMYRQTKNEREISQKRSKAGKQGGRPPKKQSESKDKANKATSVSSSISSSISTSSIKNENKQLGWFEEIWKKYPGRVGKKKSLSHFNSSVKTDQDFIDINKALNNYVLSDRVKNGYIQNGPTWFNNWRDWVDYKENFNGKTKHGPGNSKFEQTEGIYSADKIIAE